MLLQLTECTNEVARSDRPKGGFSCAEADSGMSQRKPRSRHCVVRRCEVVELDWIATALDQRETRLIMRLESGKWVS